MNPAFLSLQQAPELSTPFRFFTTAPLFLVLAGIILLLSGPEALTGRWTPGILALTHSLTLGFISMCMLGALFQLLPVLSGQQTYQNDLVSYLVFVFYTPGVILLILGFITGISILFRLAMYVIVPSLIIFSLLTAYSLYKTQSGHASTSGLKTSIISLIFTTILGTTLLYGHAWPEAPVLRHLTELHILWATAGWIVTAVIAISFQTIPMFHITDDYPELVKLYLVKLILVLLVIYSVVFFLDQFSFQVTILYFLSTVLIVYSLMNLWLLKNRRKRMPDTSLQFIVFSYIMLMISSISLIITISSPYDLSILTAILFLGGFVVPIIIGMLTKIMPFLIWYHLHRQRNSFKSTSKIPLVNELVSFRMSRWLFACYFLSISSLIASLFLHTSLLYLSGMAWTCLGLMLFGLTVRLVHQYLTFLAEQGKSHLTS